MTKVDLRTPLDQVATQFSGLVAAQVFAAACGFTANVLLALVLGPSAYGGYVLFLAIANIASLPLSWLASSIVVFGQEDVSRHGSATRTAGTIAIFGLLGLTVSASAIVLTAGPLAAIFPAVAGLAPLAVAFVTLSAVSGTVRGWLQARRAMAAYALLVALTAAIPLLLIAAVASTGAKAIAAYAAAYVLGQTLALLPFALKGAATLPRPALERSQFATIGRFVIAYIVSAAQSFLFTYGDVVMLGLFLAPPALGVYGLASRIYQQLLIFAELLGTVLFPILNGYRVAGDHARLTAFVRRRIPQLVAVVGLACSAAATAAAVALPTILGGGYSGVITVLALLMLGLLFGVWRRLISPVLTSYRTLWPSNVASTASAAVFVVGLTQLGPVAGAPGAAVAVTLAVAVDVGLNLAVLARRIGAGLERTAPIVAVAAIPIILLPALVGERAGAFPAAVLLVIGLIVYVTVLRSLRVFHSGDRALVRGSRWPTPIRAFADRTLAFVASDSAIT